MRITTLDRALLLAAASDDLPAVLKAFHDGGDINARNANGMHALGYFLRHGSLPAAISVYMMPEFQLPLKDAWSVFQLQPNEVKTDRLMFLRAIGVDAPHVYGFKGSEAKAIKSFSRVRCAVFLDHPGLILRSLAESPVQMESVELGRLLKVAKRKKLHEAERTIASFWARLEAMQSCVASTPSEREGP